MERARLVVVHKKSLGHAQMLQSQTRMDLQMTPPTHSSTQKYTYQRNQQILARMTTYTMKSMWVARIAICSQVSVIPNCFMGI